MERLCFFLRSFLIDKLWRPDEQVHRAPIIAKLRRKSKKVSFAALPHARVADSAVTYLPTKREYSFHGTEKPGLLQPFPPDLFRRHSQERNPVRTPRAAASQKISAAQDAPGSLNTKGPGNPDGKISGPLKNHNVENQRCLVEILNVRE